MSGAPGVGGLRSIADGFKAADGFDLRYIGTWSPYQRRKVREAYHGLRLIEAQPKRIIRVRNDRNFKVLKEAFHGDIKIPGLKVAFVPDPSYGRTLPGGKKPPLKVRVSATGVVSVDDGRTYRREAIFDKRKLARDPAAEITRAVAALGKDVKFLKVQAGEFETLTGDGVRQITQKIQKWMMKYNGKTPFPKGDKRFGENPKNHNYKKWLNGIVGYVPAKGVKPVDLLRRMDREFKAAKAKTKEARKRMKK